ncbi:MAG: Rid family detoxifying hydrolase [Gammaproteobacteria bacterium]|nr:Rid family detoxifying hydrolase [Gammaproteobacteria bacterium]
MERNAIRTDAAPAAIGTYSQAMSAGDWLFLSGQIGLDPETGELVPGGIEAQAGRAFENLAAVARAAGAALDDIVKLNVSLVDLADYAVVNSLMKELFAEPYPARAAVGVAALPRGALIEIEAIIAR